MTKTTIILTLALLTFGCITDNKEHHDDETEQLKQKLKEMGMEPTNVRTPKKSKTVEVGDRIELYGGYDDEPKYLKNPPAKSRTGTVIEFIKTERGDFSAVVRLDTTIRGDSITGNIVVLSTRYVGQDWSMDGPVHIELCNFMPKPDKNGKREFGEWTEAAASYRLLGKDEKE